MKILKHKYIIHFSVADKISARVHVIREHFNLKYSASFVICPVPSGGVERGLPISVSVIAEAEPNKSGNKIKILNTEFANDLGQVDAQLSAKRNLGICVKPIHYDYFKTMELIEFVELNRILGVEHFTLYNKTISKETNCVLKKYVQEGFVQVLPWQSDLVSQVEIR